MGSSHSTVNEYQTSYSIDIRLNNATQNITYTIVSSGRSTDRSIVKSITTVATNRTVTHKVDPTTRQLTDTNGNLMGKDGDFSEFLLVVKHIASTLSVSWDAPEEVPAVKEETPVNEEVEVKEVAPEETPQPSSE